MAQLKDTTINGILTLKDDYRTCNVMNYLPIIKIVDVPAFKASDSSSSRDIYVPVKLKSTNIAFFAKQIAYVGKTTEVWLTCQFVSATLDGITFRFYNEQRVDINASKFAIAIFDRISDM